MGEHGVAMMMAIFGVASFAGGGQEEGDRVTKSN